MPPKKRTRVPQVTSPEASSVTEPPTHSATGSPEKPEEKEGVQDVDNSLANLWTDEEEIGLFKGLMRWKPTGIHKHFRLLALHNWLLQNQYIQPSNAHTSLSGIRAKLQTLYDLETLDAREDARQLSKIDNPLISDKDKGSDDDDDDADAYSEAANKIETEPFTLPPEADFELLIWKCRFAPTEGSRDGSESPPAMADLNLANEPPVEFTPSFSVEPSEVATPRPRATRGRGGRGRGRGGSAAASALTRRRSARQVESVADEEEEKSEPEEDEEGEEDDDDDEEESDGDEEEGDGSNEEDEDGGSQSSTPAPAFARSMRGRRGRGPASSSAAASRRTRKRQR